MKRNCLYNNSYRYIGMILIALTASLNSTAQNYCANEAAIFTENFGSGTTATTNADITTGLTYQATGDLNDGANLKEMLLITD